VEAALADLENLLVALREEKLLELKTVDEEKLHALLVAVLSVAELQNPSPASTANLSFSLFRF
jgi:hypothetical protein